MKQRPSPYSGESSSGIKPALAVELDQVLAFNKVAENNRIRSRALNRRTPLNHERSVHSGNFGKHCQMSTQRAELNRPWLSKTGS